MLPASMTVLERGWLSSNSIVFHDSDGVAVVDTGYAAHAEQTAQLIEHARRDRPVTRIVNTHLHSDHVGANALLQAIHRPKTWIPPGEADAVAAWDEATLSYGACGQHCPRFVFDAVLEAGRTIELGGLAWEVVAAPGHDPHMVMLFNADEAILISADALWQDGFGAIFGEVDGKAGFAEQRAVLQQIEQRRPRVVIPGHGAVFVAVDAALRNAYRRLDALASDPERNARHVLKSLVKFWLLEVRAVSKATLIRHFEQTGYFRVIHTRFFPRITFEEMLLRTVADLERVGAVRRTDDLVQNCDT